MIRMVQERGAMNIMDIGNNTNINSRKDKDKDNSTSNNFKNNTYKLVFKGIKSRN
jgi:hypothetical protein